MHWGFDNSPLLILFKWTLYELCISILRQDFHKSDSIVQTQCTKVVLLFRFRFISCVYSDQKTKTFSRLKVTIWLVNIISTEHDQEWWVMRSSMRSRNRGKILVRSKIFKHPGVIWVKHSMFHFCFRCNDWIGSFCKNYMDQRHGDLCQQ